MHNVESCINSSWGTQTQRKLFSSSKFLNRKVWAFIIVTRWVRGKKPKGGIYIPPFTLQKVPKTSNKKKDGREEGCDKGGATPHEHSWGYRGAVQSKQNLPGKTGPNHCLQWSIIQSLHLFVNAASTTNVSCPRQNSLFSLPIPPFCPLKLGLLSWCSSPDFGLSEISS